MQKSIALLTLLLSVLGVHAATAQPVCSPSVPGSVACQSQAVNLQPTDILAGTQAAGPLRANQSVKVSLSQVLNLAGSSQYVPFNGGVMTGKLTTTAPGTGSAGFTLTPGTAPSAPVNGDVWTTTSGLFVQSNGTTLGPLGAGGGVNAGTLNALGYYASAGNNLSPLATSANGVLVTNGSSVPSITTTLPSGLTIPGATVTPLSYATAGVLPGVTSGNAGQQAYVVNCLNGTETGGGGTGCLYLVNSAGTWTPRPSVPTQQITIGGQALYLGQATTNQGNGSKLATFNGTGTSGDCVSINATGALVDAGSACGGGGGGSGTVTTGSINQLAWYSSSGTAVAGLATANNSVLVTSAGGVPSLSATLPTGLTIPGVILRPAVYATTGALPSVTSANAGQEGFVTNCLNGTEAGGGGTGCYYIVNNSGTWTPLPTIPTQQITVGGQALSLGGATTNQGNGSKIATFNGSGVSGDCVSINATGALIDAGGVCGGGGGGSGTVTAGTVNQLAWYSSSGTAVAGLATANSSVLITSAGGVPSMATTLPTGLTIPGVILRPLTYATSAALPGVTSANAGQEGFVTNCLNGSETGGGGTGCLYLVNAAGTWVPRPSQPTQQITIGGQALYLGQATTNQGNGAAIATFTGTGTSGHCVSINASGALVDAGSACGATGGSGTVSAGTVNQLAWYSASGSAVAGLSTANSSVLITSAGGVPSLSATLPAGLTLPAAIMQAANYATSAALPAVTSANAGQEGFVTNCLNGTESGGAGTGCYYLVNNAGTWVPQPRIPTQQITVGGQALSLGQATTNQGNGSAIATFSGTGTSGHCVSINAGGALTDAGAACGSGSGGSGTVTAGTVNQLAWYSSTGTAVAGLASVNNGVLVTNGSGVPSLGATLPTGLTLPSATISNPALTGAGTYAGLTGSGKLITAASTTTQAGLNLIPGAAPTTPANGDMWSTTAGFFVRYNGGTFPVGSGNGTITGITTPGPITGGGTTGALTLNCSTCLTTGSGGLLTVTSPLTLTGSALAIGNQTRPFIFSADQYTTIANALYNVFLSFPYATGSISSVSYLTGGTGSPSFTIAVQVNGVNVTTCNGITVSSATRATTTCGANSIVSGNPVTLIISGVNGAPSSAAVQINYVASAS